MDGRKEADWQVGMHKTTNRRVLLIIIEIISTQKIANSAEAVEWKPGSCIILLMSRCSRCPTDRSIPCVLIRLGLIYNAKWHVSFAALYYGHETNAGVFTLHYAVFHTFWLAIRRPAMQDPCRDRFSFEKNFQHGMNPVFAGPGEAINGAPLMQPGETEKTHSNYTR